MQGVASGVEVVSESRAGGQVVARVEGFFSAIKKPSTAVKRAIKLVVAARENAFSKTSSGASHLSWDVLCCNALHFKHCGVIYRLEPMPKYRHTMRLVVNVQNVAFTPRR
jgi:hypothetical protein